MEVQNWLQNKGFPDLRPCLEPLVQACHLLQSRKDESNLDTICGEMTDLLKPRQVQRFFVGNSSRSRSLPSSSTTHQDKTSKNGTLTPNF